MRLDFVGIGIYLAIVLAAYGLGALLRRIRRPSIPILLVLGLLVGRTGLELVAPDSLPKLRSGAFLHVSFLLGVVGYRLGEGLLRLPLSVALRRTVAPLAVGAAWLALGSLGLPLLLAEVEPDRSFLRFFLPLAGALAAFALLAIRDLRGPPGTTVGSLFLVAVGMIGAVVSFTPALLWYRELDPGIVWRGPILILGESGALGVAGAIVYLVLARIAPPARFVVAALVLLAMAWATGPLWLWMPFAALGFGIALGRIRHRGLVVGPTPSRILHSEEGLVFLSALAFAPDLFFDHLVPAALLHAGLLVALLLTARALVPRGRDLVTGPGLLFLGLALSMRLDGRMGPLGRYTIDLVLPAWVLLRVLMALLQSRAATKIISSESSS